MRKMKLITGAGFVLVHDRRDASVTYPLAASGCGQPTIDVCICSVAGFEGSRHPTSPLPHPPSSLLSPNTTWRPPPLYITWAGLITHEAMCHC
ncbi:hypothetical protein E2C01_012528 [Portunus trituberculatus]|uniref:Uncharacterized protein n=1 Tax=Portunus trituberculatus TaxID=210409 RepID=A0A5B7DEF4_PORTR|nr:hypothetical protein [Portunus trituberculatus]